MKELRKSVFRLFALIGVVFGAYYIGKALREKASQKTSLLPAVIDEEDSIPAHVSVAVKPMVRTKSQPKRTSNLDLSDRQKVVYAIIKGKKAIEMKDLLPRIPGVTERTLRRDLLKLQEVKLISKQGTTKASNYVLVK